MAEGVAHKQFVEPVRLRETTRRMKAAICCGVALCEFFAGWWGVKQILALEAAADLKAKLVFATVTVVVVIAAATVGGVVDGLAKLGTAIIDKIKGG